MLQKIDLSKKAIKKFGISLSLVLIIWATFLYLKHKGPYLWLYNSAIILFLISIIFPVIIKPLYIIWMKIAYIISWIITHLILIVVFYVIITPVGLVMRLFGYDPLERKMDKKRQSYWVSRLSKEFSPKDFERLF